MYNVYILRSQKFPDKMYINTSNKSPYMFVTHNHGEGNLAYIKKYGPWDLIWCGSFRNKTKALEFEHFLNSDLGQIFMQKRLI
ncbi:MAG: GIY-YIG nuclease family protein [Candidatus Babeliales bacterium]